MDETKSMRLMFEGEMLVLLQIPLSEIARRPPEVLRRQLRQLAAVHWMCQHPSDPTLEKIDYPLPSERAS